MINKKLSIIIVFLVLVFGIWYLTPRYSNIEVNSNQIKVELANNTYKQARGLSNRADLAQGQGMLFIFSNEDIPGIWMKDMNFNIDVIWLNEQGKVIYFKENISPDTYPEVFKPEQIAKYVLELPGHSIGEYNIKLNDQVRNLP